MNLLSNKKYSLTGDKSFLFLIILAGSILRLFVAANKQIWFDEALSIYIARLPLMKLFPFAIRSWEMHPPLYHLLLKLLLNVNSSELWLRIVSVCCGSMVIYMTYRLASLVFDKYVGLLSCSLVAFSEAFISHSCGLRVYIIWALFSILSVYFLVKLLAIPSRKNIILHILFTVLAIYAHYFGFFILLAELLFLFLNKQASKLNAQFRFFIIGWIIILIIPNIIYAFIKFRNFPVFGEYYAASKPTPITILYLFIGYSDYTGILILYFLITNYVLIKKINLVLFKRGLLENLKQMMNYLSSSLRLSLVFFYFLLPIVIVFIVFQYKYSVFNEPRFFLPFFVFYYFAVAWSCSLSGERLKKWLFVFLISITFLNALRYSVVLVEQQSSFGLEKISKSLKPGLEEADTLAVTNIFYFLPIFNYLNRPIKILTAPQYIKEGYILKVFIPQDDEIIKDFGTLKNKKRLWLIAENDAGRSFEWLTKNPQVKLIKERYFSGAKLLLYNINN